MRHRRMFWVIVALLSVFAMNLRIQPPQAAQAQEPGVNLLRNGDFEEGSGGAWPFQDGIPEVQIAPGWRGFYVDNPPSYAKIPVHCVGNPDCSYWRRPEFRGVSSGEFSYRVHQGFLAQKYFTFAGQHEAGLYQQVGGITPGTQLRFSAYMVTWSCMPSATQWNVCPTTPLSSSPAPMHTKVGIDPTGGTNPWSPNIVWSPELNAIDNWTLFSVEAKAANSTVTVFTYSWADWTDHFFRLNNDVYLDTASLVVVGNPVPRPTGSPTPGAVETPVTVSTPVPVFTATPLPDGTVVHTVRQGDTLNAIASDYGVPADQIIALNALANPGLLIVGQELIISKPGSVVQPTATPPVATTSPEPTPQGEEQTIPATSPEPTPQGGEQAIPSTSPEPVSPDNGQAAVSGGGKLCVLAFQDLNQDGVQQSEELLLPGITFTIRSASGEPALYTTDGAREPYCLDALAAGQYQVVAQAVSGYRPTLASAYMVVIDQSTPIDLVIGFIRDDTVPQASATEKVPATQESPSTDDKTPSRLPLILGITTVVLLLAAGGVGFFVLRRR